MERAEFQILNTPIWPGIGSGGLHKAPETSGSCDAKKRNKIADLSRQHLGPGTGGILTEERHGRSGRDALPSRVHQHKEINLRANAGNQFHRGHEEDGPAPSTGENVKDHESVSTHDQPGKIL